MSRMAKKKYKEGEQSNALPEKIQVLNELRMLESNVSNMYKEYERYYSKRRNKRLPTLKHYLDFYLNWMEAQTNWMDHDQFIGNQMPINKSNPANGVQLILSYNPYERISLVWKIRYDLLLIRKLKNAQPELKETVAYHTLYLAKGIFTHARLSRMGPAKMMASYYISLDVKKILVFCILPERVPILRNGTISGYSYSQYLRFIDIIQNPSEILKVVDRCIKKFCTHPDRFLCFQHGDRKEVGAMEENRAAGTAIEALVSIKKDPLLGVELYCPKIIEQEVKLSKKEIADITYNSTKKRWESKEEIKEFATETNYLEQTLAREENRKAMREIASAESCRWLVSFFETIPNFRLKLTEEEKTLIGQSGNILAIGRSGTGKTTCALLRLFATEVLYKVKSTFANNAILKDTRFRAEDVDSNCGLHSVFVTASPVLTNEVRRYYGRLNDKIKSELKKKEERRAKIQKEEDNPKDVEVVSKSELEEQKETVGTEEMEDIEEELELIDEGELEKQLSIAHNLDQVREEEFPLFLTVRRLIMMVDGTLRRPFFSRNSRGEVLGLEGNAEWHNESKGIMMINTQHKYYNDNDDTIASKLETVDPGTILDELEREEEEEELEYETEENYARAEEIRRKKNYSQMQHKGHYMGREIDFEVFAKKFWPVTVNRLNSLSAVQKRKFTPASIWKEIHTHIKGGVEAHEYAAHHLPRYRYEELVKNKTVFTQEEQKMIYEIFYHYERWGWSYGYFDMSDVVNHILSFIKWHGYKGQPIHFIMCDEVQDLPPATLLLLMKLSEQNIFFSGDTAQTIAQGVNFRFSDLRSIFYNYKMEAGMPSILQLSTNFRSHARILDLANSVIRVVELFFPNSIDKLKKENSPLDGIMPIVLNSDLHNSLFNLLLGTDSHSKQEGLLSKPPLEFGCDQVIIVRNQKAKDNLPSFLKHALCLTIYEAKGLEFDDVILYNFFTDSEAESEWKLLRNIQVSDIKVPLDFFKDEVVMSFDQLAAKTSMIPEGYKDLKEGEYQIIKNVDVEKVLDNVEVRYSALITELKQLYTAITRPRQRLIIFDENPLVREPMLNYWMSLGYIKVVSKEELDPSTKKSESEAGKLLNCLSGANTSKAGWRMQGIKMFKRKYYEQAAKCFTHSGDEALQTRSEAYHFASMGSEATAEIETLKYSISIETQKEEKLVATEKIKNLNTKMINYFEQAAMRFEKLNMKMQAGQCYFSIQNYLKAAECFEGIKQFAQAGEAYFKLEQYEKAGELYEIAEVPTNAIVAFEQLKNYERILNIIHRFKDKLADDHRQKLVKKYIQLALQQIFQEFEKAQAESCVGEGVRQEELEAIKEKDENPFGESSEILSERSMEQSVAPSASQNESKVLENEFEEIDSKSSGTNPFEEVNLSKEKSTTEKSEDFSLLEGEKEKKKPRGFVDADHIASLDPDDEWIQCETGSIIESVISGKITNSNKNSDYSMIDNAHAFAVNCSLVKTKRDIFVEDQVMSKVIKYVSYFSEEVQNSLDSLRSKSVLLHKTEPSATTGKSTADFIIDMDEIDLPFVNLILDILEQLGLYKLCIIICNRYQINERIGRYIVAIAHRYSNIKMVCEGYDKYIERNGTFREMQMKNSIIANAAVHSVFEVVNPDYLRLKKHSEMVDDSNSLGIYCYRSLLMLGYWKKLVYILDCENSMQLTSSFADYYNFKLLYLINFSEISQKNFPEIQQKIQQCSFDWIPFKEPSSKFEESALIIAYDSVISDLNRIFPSTYQHDRSPDFIPIKKSPVFPDCFPNAQAFYNVLFDPSYENLDYLEKVLNTSCREFMSLGKDSHITFKNTCFIWDFCCTAFQFVFGNMHENSQTALFSLSSLTYNNLLQCIHGMINILCLGKTENHYSDAYYVIFRACLASLGIRRMEGSDLRIGAGRGYIMHRDSIFFHQIISLVKEKKMERKKEIENNVTVSLRRYMHLDKKAFEHIMQDELRIAMEVEHSKLDTIPDTLFIDLETDYVFLSPEMYSKEIGTKLSSKVLDWTLMRMQNQEQTSVPKLYRISDIWSIENMPQIREETYQTAMVIGEISYTLQILKHFNNQVENLYYNKAQKINYLDYYFAKIEAKKKLEETLLLKEKGKIGMTSKKKKKKANAVTPIEILLNTRKSMYYKLQYLSIILFSSGNHTHINAEDWVLQNIQTSISSVFYELPEGIENQVFPTLCCFLAVDKYILFVEQLRALQFTKLRRFHEAHITWLDALAEFKANCLEDCFTHLVQYFNYNRSELDILSKLIIVEKVVTICSIILNSLKGKSSSKILFPSNLLKHGNFKRIEGVENKYAIETYMRVPEYEEEPQDFINDRNKLINQLIDDVEFFMSISKKKFALDSIQVILIALGLDPDEDPLEIKRMIQKIKKEGKCKFEPFYRADVDWDYFRKRTESSPDILALVGLKQTEWSFNFTIQQVEFIHNARKIPDVDQLEKDGISEYKQMATHLHIYKALKDKKISRDIVKQKQEPFKLAKNELSLELRRFGHKPEALSTFWKIKQNGFYYQLMEFVKDMHLMVLNTFYKTPIFNVLDAHYLFTRIEELEDFYQDVIRLTSRAIEPQEKSKEIEPLPNAKEIRDNVEKMREELKIWKNNKFMPDEEYIEKKKIIYRSKWKQHKKQLHQKKVSKMANKKRQKALMLKAITIKGKSKGFDYI